MVELQFPDGFLWGAATSAHQVEGNNVHSDWWAWEQAGRVKEQSGLACDHYRRFAGDFDLALSLGHNAHRFSIEWSRIEPRQGQWNDEALQHYVEVVRALRTRGLEPIVTLHHFTTPQWIAEAGSWVNPKIVDWFGRYTERVVKAMGNLVRYWVTINEPMVYVKMHYVEGKGPPGPTTPQRILRVIEHLIRAHAVSYGILHRATQPGQLPPRVSVAKHYPLFVPCRPWWLPDQLSAWWVDQFFNAAFLSALTEGRWSVPGLRPWTIREAKGTLDFLGLNFYGRQFIRFQLPAGGRLPHSGCDLSHHARQIPERTLLGWDVCPDAFTEALLRCARLGLPILVTENGTWMDDAARWRYIVRYVAAMRRAMEQGASVIGYLYWSLLDNFEWADGFGPRFGLVEVDYATQQRRIRDSGLRYAEVCRTNRLQLDDTMA